MLLFSFAISACGISSALTPVNIVSTATLSAETESAQIAVKTSDVRGVFFGAYGADSETEKALDQKFAIQLYYSDWTTQFNGSPAELYAGKNQILLYTWEYRPALNGPDDPYILQPLKAILDGDRKSVV